ncbi:hypothetical protein M0804_011591 [Polistes exclamans]|nr:hypothetical protein M0804_011591 [Polistes exclamans]
MTSGRCTINDDDDDDDDDDERKKRKIRPTKSRISLCFNDDYNANVNANDDDNDDDDDNDNDDVRLPPSYAEERFVQEERKRDSSISSETSLFTRTIEELYIP